MREYWEKGFWMACFVEDIDDRLEEYSRLYLGYGLKISSF